ncbi:hypothetical protein CASFOL_028967 [Castilleja foliolosa]|uniref:Receptor-like serine/threonine-protein kinase n=1 Tax=Castilleja foliolosa TaxID=1961234 RepID=A0ABD3CE80_9LAMI
MALLFLSLTSLIITTIDAKNTLTPPQSLNHGQTLISDNNRFELGFFNASSTRDPTQNSLYLGIWYKQIKPLTVVWVANRLTPLRGDHHVNLIINLNGHLLLHDDQGNIIPFAKPDRPVRKPSLVLLDSGNLVVKENDKKYIWQSFDYPTDTLLPGMKLGRVGNSNPTRFLTSWRNSEDPSDGDFVFSVDSDKSSDQLLLEKNGLIQSRWGPWDGKKISGTDMKNNNNTVFRIVYYYGPDEVYFSFEMLDDKILLRMVVSPAGTVQFLKWEVGSGAWVPMVTLNKDVCDRYGSCGPYGVCYANGPSCRCLEGFEENLPYDWRAGCRRRNVLNCSDGDHFVRYGSLKLPDKFRVWRGLGSEQCGDSCLKACACMAYTIIDIYGKGNECVVWLDQLFDLRDSSPDGDEIYIRMARSELGRKNTELSISNSKKMKKRKIFTVITSFVIAAFLTALWCTTNKCIRPSKTKMKQVQKSNLVPVEYPEDDQYIQLFCMSIVSAATNNFSLGNKIGQGGFGPVYQGKFKDGQKIAVKTLSENSSQGLLEFKNEINLIAHLQHRNLVKLLGCCIEGDERMLVYEYMTNKSLDQFIFDSVKKVLLPWQKRFSILKGIAKGLDYLHFGSRLRVIHRDLKASNILLDDEMNPKISDFGLARNFENEKEETTRRVIGTHGYMSPEYVINGLYSIKSDVFSFGVLALEIISGKRNWGFYHPDHEYNLLGHAWKLWNEGRGLELMDPILEDSFVEIEVIRCVEIGLWCVQHRANDRPTMSQVVCMLENENVRLSEPQEPGFFGTRLTSTPGFASSMGWNQVSQNGLTVTDLTGRT